MPKIERKFKNCDLIGAPFSPCITDGMWCVSRWDVVHTDTNKRAMYFFGSDGIHATLYNKNNPDFQLTDLAYDTLIKHLEKNPYDFKTGSFRFEFDGQRFNYCKEEPKWAEYDCGILED